MSVSLPSAAGAPRQAASTVAGTTEQVAAPSREQLESSQRAIRDTTKWLVAAAAAVGAVVVAGLQLSHLPTGFWATVAALGGFVIALLGVAVVIFSAAGVLSVGYTTLGELSDLYNAPTDRLEAKGKWDKKKKQLNQKKKGGTFLGRITARAQLPVLKLFYEYRIRRIRRLKENGVNIEEMILYLDKDALVLSSLLAQDIPELYSRIKDTDREILRIRGQKPSQFIIEQESSAAPGQETQQPVQRDKENSAAPGQETQQPVQRDKENSGSSGTLSLVEISETEWCADQLEAAAGQLIAFANQRVIEERFGALKRSVQYGGLAVLIGVGLFALAPKWAQPIPLTVAGPTSVIVVVKAPAEFGPDCTLTQLNGIAIGGTWDEPIIVTEATDGCRATRLVLKLQIGFAIPVVGGSASAKT